MICNDLAPSGEREGYERRKILVTPSLPESINLLKEPGWVVYGAQHVNGHSVIYFQERQAGRHGEKPASRKRERRQMAHSERDEGENGIVVDYVLRPAVEPGTGVRTPTVIGLVPAVGKMPPAPQQESSSAVLEALGAALRCYHNLGLIKGDRQQAREVIKLTVQGLGDALLFAWEEQNKES